MQLNLETEIRDIEGEPLKEQKVRFVGQERKVEVVDITLRKVLVNAIMGEFEDERGKINGEEKLRRFNLGLQIQNTEDKFYLRSKDFELVKELVNKAYGTYITGFVWTLLEESEESEESEVKGEEKA